MANSKDKVDRIGAWSKEKLDILSEYLRAYTTIMNAPKQQRWCAGFYYVDAFTGTIKPQDKETKEYLAGSPIRSLTTSPKFSGYYFIEIKPGRVAIAENLKTEYPNHEVNVLCGDCNKILQNTILPMLQRNSNCRALVFLDPYGLQVRWDTVVALASAKVCDIFINFPVMGILRNLPIDKEPDLKAIDAINLVFGDEKWKDGLYVQKTAVQCSLFGGTAESSVRRHEKLIEHLTTLYLEKIKSLGLKVSAARLMKNSKNSPLYALFLASPKETGVRIMNDIFNKYEQLSIRGNKGR